MKILSVVQCRSIWGGNMSDLNPSGKSNPNVSQELRDRYGFQIAPNSIYAAIRTSPEQTATLEHGSFANKKGDRIQISLTLSSAYVAADTRSSTDDSDAFLEDLHAWFTQTYGLGDHRKVFTKRYYVSTLYVSFDKPLNAINPKLAALAVSAGKDIPGFGATGLEVGAIQFWPDTTQTPRPVPFRFERQAETKLGENRYFVSAPLTTAQHLKLLRDFESALG
jgi:hypothetical protein